MAIAPARPTRTTWGPVSRVLRWQGLELATRPTPVVDWPEFDRGPNPKRNKDQEHNPLNDRERRLGPSRREVVKGRDLQEGLRDKHEHVEIKRRDRTGDKDPSPGAGEAEAVIGGDRACEQDEREDSDGARRVEAER